MFGKDKKTKEEKENEKIQKYLQMYGLDKFTDQEDRDMAYYIAHQLYWQNFTDFFSGLAANEKDMLKSIQGQNYILMMQNNMIIRQLEKLNQKK